METTDTSSLTTTTGELIRSNFQIKFMLISTTEKTISTVDPLLRNTTTISNATEEKGNAY